jgi:glyoxylase-like metal-dependent hydrolase (beta-lactamase superfamily II)
VREVQTGLWHWEAPHPDWTPEQGAEYGWGPEVSSYAVDDGERLLLFDPWLAERDREARGRPRDGNRADLPVAPARRRRPAERFAAPIYVSPNPRDPNPVPGHVFSAGERLPVGVEAFPGMEPNDLMLWFESRPALVAGDTLLDRGQGLEISWPPPEQVGGAAAQGQILEALLPVLELPVELVLPAHGAPSDRPVLVRALSCRPTA